MSDKQRIEWFDNLRVLATIGVIIIHISTPIVKVIYGRNMEFWWIGNVVDSFVRYSVPAFLMLTGASMLGRKYNTWDFYKKRINRVFVPFLFWAVIYIVFRWLVLRPNEIAKAHSDVWGWLLNLVFKEGISQHFWYIYLIFYLYLVLPFMASALSKISKTNLIQIIGIWAIINLAFMLFDLKIQNHALSEAINYCRLGGYMLLGYYLSISNYSFLSKKWFAISLLLFTGIFTAISTYYISKQTNHLNFKFYSSLSINAILQVTSILLIAKNFNVKNKFLIWARDFISDYSFGIYLVHIIVIGVLYLNKIFWTMAHPLISLPIVFLLTLSISGAIIFLLRKIPYGKYISG